MVPRRASCCQCRLLLYKALLKHTVAAITSPAGRFHSRPGTIFQTCPHLRSNQSSLMTTVLGHNWLDSSHIHFSILWSRGHRTTASHVVITATWGNVNVWKHKSVFGLKAHTWCPVNVELPSISSVAATEWSDRTKSLLEVEHKLCSFSTSIISPISIVVVRVPQSFCFSNSIAGAWTDIASVVSTLNKESPNMGSVDYSNSVLTH